MLEDRPVTGRLDSWKEIAAYLHRDVRTVIRWEQEKSLPVHRVPGGQRKAVFAFTHEIDAWLLGQPANGNHGSVIAAVEEAPEESPVPATEITVQDRHAPVVAGPQPVAAAQRTLNVSKWNLIGAAVSVLALIWITGAMLARPHEPATIRTLSLNKLTDDRRTKGNLRTDGTTLYFNEAEGARSILASAPVSGSPIRPIETPFSNVALQDLSSDGKTLLFTSYEGIMIEGALWTMPVQGGLPRRVGEASCDVARWSPDNRRIACVNRTRIMVMDADGSNTRTVKSFSSPVSQITWTPDGGSLRYVLDDIIAHTSSQWEMPVDGEGPGQAKELGLGPGCCLDWGWTRNGAFIYTEVDAGGRQRLMMHPGSFPAPIELPVNIGNLWNAAPGRNGNTLYLAISDSSRGELLKYDSRQKALETFLPGVSGVFVAYSPDGQWISYSDSRDYSLWRSRADGSDALPLARPPMQVQVSSWSPDGHQIAFMGQAPGKPFRIYLAGRDGGPLREASEGNENQGGPSWSPDGRFIVYGNVFCEKTQSCWIHRLEPATGKTEILPGSNGLRTARWSPDGKNIAALRFQTRELMLFNVAAQQWKTLAGSVGGDNINWSSDSQYIYVDSPRDKKPIVERIRITDGHRATVVSLTDLQKVPGTMNTWFGLTPDNSPILSQFLTSSEIYELQWTDR